MPAAWSLMLAARARGIGSVFTCIHLMHEEEAAAALDIPYRRVMQAGLIPLAYTIGDRFRPATASRWTTSSTGTNGRCAQDYAGRIISLAPWQWRAGAGMISIFRRRRGESAGSADGHHGKIRVPQVFNPIPCLDGPGVD